jgi:hypothetical protein
MAFDLKNYEEVKDRIPRFWAKYPRGAITTELIYHDATDYIVKATLHDDDHRVISTGLAHEKVGATPVNKTSALENCETSAIGRALANHTFSSSAHARPSREEMDKASRPEPPTIDALDAEILVGRLTTIGKTIKGYPDAWVAAKLPTIGNIGTLEVSRLEQAKTILTEAEASLEPFVQEELVP